MAEAKRLGRGLEALLGPVSREQAAAAGLLHELPVETIRPNPYQPRTRLDPDALAELTASIGVSGLLQPIVVRPRPGGYELIAGERRWRAAQQLGWRMIPAVVKEADDRTLLALALVENLQRDALSSIDEALGYQRLQTEFQLPQTEVARLVGRNRATVANLLRLLQLPEEVQALVHEGTLSEGHGRALLGAGDRAAMLRLAREAVAKGWSVREMESQVREAPGRGKGRKGKPAKTEQHVSAEVRRVEEALRRRLGTDVKISQRRKGRGSLMISYYSNDDLARVLEVILGEPFAG